MTQLSPDPSPRARPFADAVADYALAGWPCVLPVPPREKTPPPSGFTGAEGRDTDPVTLVTWAGTHGTSSIALRMPEHVIGIDVDSYEKAGTRKHGAETFAAYLQRWGPLPPTWTSTARGEGPSRIHFYRVPPGRYATRLVTDPGPGQTGDVEIIQRHHRYAVVWPSPHPGAEPQADGSVAIYRWYAPDGSLAERVPSPSELPELPTAWVEGLAAGAAGLSAASADRASGEALLEQLELDGRPECADVTSARLGALELLSRAEAGSRHDAMTERTHHLVQLAAAGHPGVARAIAEVRFLWSELTAGEDRAEELERALLTSARKAVTAVGPVQVPRDPCLLMAGGQPYATPLPSQPAHVQAELETAREDEILEPPRWASLREVIGAHSFDPNAGLDQSLAEHVLARMHPALRYAYDSGGWLLRTPDRWELHKRLSPWAVAQVAPLMPIGDPTAEKGSEPAERAKRRARFMTAGGAGAIAKSIDALVAGGMHPASVALADLDADPEILWAGGMPYSLRDSLSGPAFAQTDPATPHLRTTGVRPENGPTPLWDAFLEAVWPDPAIRAWAVRVLAISLTGYADRALPILLGETGRGKTQVIHLVMSVLGSYAHAANPKLLNPATNEHDTIVFALKGRRLSFIDEAPRDAKAGQERLKQLTGGGELTARQMNQDPITFRPTHTLLLTANDEPVLTDPAIRSRVRLIPCEGDPELVRSTRAAIGHVSSAAWRTEAPAVLARLMGEAAAWLADPSTAYTSAAPEQIRYLAEHLGAEQDPVGMWVTEETEPSEEGTGARELYQAFVASCRRNSMRADLIPSETKWGRTLTRLGYPSVHGMHGKRRQLRIQPGDFMPGAPAPTPDTSHIVDFSPTTESSAGGHDGLTPEYDGLMTGSNATRHEQNPRSDTAFLSEHDGLTGCTSDQAVMCTHTPTRTRGIGDSAPTRHGANSDAGSDLRKRAHSDPLANPSSAQKAAKKPADPAKTEAARVKREEARLAKIAAAVAEAGGPTLQLPAVVVRHPEQPGQTVIGELTAAEIDVRLEQITRAPNGELTVDVETSGYPVGHEHFALRTVQLGCEAWAVVLDPADPEQADVVRRHLALAPILHAHSATADLVPLEAAGLLEDGAEAAWLKMRDTVTLAKLADPALTGSDPGLKQISTALLREHGLSKACEDERKALFKAGRWLTETKVTTPLERSGWAQVDSRCATMIRYAASDVLDDAAIAPRLQAANTATHAVLEREHLAQRLTARVAHRGLRIDGEHTQTLLAEHREARAHHADRVRRMTAQLGEAAIDNPGSNPQVGAAFAALGAALPRTATGKPSVAEGVLDPLAKLAGPEGDSGNPAADLARAVLDYRHHDTAVGTFLEPYAELVRNGDGRARPTVYTLAADTGRMSCVRPNLQQVPREGGFRACITADPGQLLVSADFAGVELRVAAALSQDQNLLRILSDPERDLHWEIARVAFGPGATKADRYAAKRGVFGRIYGGGVDAIARGVGVSEATARAVIDAMDQLTPGLTEWSRMVRTSIESGHTQFATYSGRVVHLPKDRPHAGPNYCIQGTARELLVDALARWSLTPWADATLLPVHDELVVAVPEDQAADATAALEQAMTSDLFGVPIHAEASAPTYAWSDSV